MYDAFTMYSLYNLATYPWLGLDILPSSEYGKRTTSNCFEISSRHELNSCFNNGVNVGIQFNSQLDIGFRYWLLMTQSICGN